MGQDSRGQKTERCQLKDKRDAGEFRTRAAPGVVTESSERQTASLLAPVTIEPTTTTSVSGVPDALEVTTPALEITDVDRVRVVEIILQIV